MIVRLLTLFVLLLFSVYITVAQGVRRFQALTVAPPAMRDDLQFWGFVYMFIGSIVFAGACALGFYWLAQALHKKK